MIKYSNFSDNPAMDPGKPFVSHQYLDVYVQTICQIRKSVTKFLKLSMAMIVLVSKTLFCK